MTKGTPYNRINSPRVTYACREVAQRFAASYSEELCSHHAQAKESRQAQKQRRQAPQDGQPRGRPARRSSPIIRNRAAEAAARAEATESSGLGGRVGRGRTGEDRDHGAGPGL